MVFWHGLVVSAGLIVAIGAQNAFILKQGLKQQHVLWVCLVCAISDTILILLAVFGFAQFAQQGQIWLEWLKYIGALFLFIYGAQHFYRAFTAQQQLEHNPLNESHIVKIILLCLTFTWLNPHTYLDTMLLGAISVNFGEMKYFFALGSVLASWLFFFSLGFGARWLEPYFKDDRAWKILDIFIAMTMWYIAYTLI